MRMTIVCEDRHVDEVRLASQSLIRGNNMRIPLSPTGEAPATHWMCVLQVNDEGRQRLASLKKHSLMANASPKALLQEMGLKRIKRS